VSIYSPISKCNSKLEGANFIVCWWILLSGHLPRSYFTLAGQRIIWRI